MTQDSKPIIDRELLDLNVKAARLYPSLCKEWRAMLVESKHCVSYSPKKLETYDECLADCAGPAQERHRKQGNYEPYPYFNPADDIEDAMALLCEARKTPGGLIAFTINGGLVRQDGYFCTFILHKGVMGEGDTISEAVTRACVALRDN